ncbi:MAG TPA: sulfatase [Pirellulaceae bacterium]|jgi:arylsulfatase A-like enzyme|nr:sulfatase [Pirellulaceae bacterium]
MPARLFLACFLAALACSAAVAAARQPNVVMILADDLGWADTSLYGLHELHRTPHIERLAFRGMRFTNACAASPVCSPTRNSLLTGLSPARTGMLTAHGSRAAAILSARLDRDPTWNAELLLPISATRIRPTHVTLAERLKSEGYATGHFGKWHIGRPPYVPTKNGFDVESPEAYSARAPGGYFNSRGQHIDDLAAIDAVDFIRENKSRPFFLNYWSFSVHAPYQAKPELVAANARQAAAIGSSCSPTYAAMVQTLDGNVGRLLSAIDRFGLAGDTIVIFASDNGGTVHQRIDGVPVTTNAPLRSGKGTLYEGGVRVPFVVFWPGVIEANSVSDALVQTTDIYPTLLDLLGLQSRRNQAFDGISFAPALEGKPFRRRVIFSYFPYESMSVDDRTSPSASVRVDDLKLIRFFHAGPGGTHRHELYDLAADPGETSDLSGERPLIVSSLDAMIEGYLDDARAVVPQPNPAFALPSL